MLCERSCTFAESRRKAQVLILVVMEYALRGRYRKPNWSHIVVLILVVMEYALRVCAETDLEAANRAS